MIPRVHSNSGVCFKPSPYSYQLREVAVTTRGYLHLVLFRAYCCRCELQAAGQARSYLLLVQKSKRHIPTYLHHYNTPSAAPFSLAIHASGNKIFIKLKPHATRTDTYRRSCLSDTKETRNSAASRTPPPEKAFR